MTSPFLRTCGFASLALSVLFPGVLMAQDNDESSKFTFNYQNVLPGTPENASLGSYGNTSISTASGRPDISFTLYTVSYGGVSVPIRIAYDPSGVRYSDIPSALGMKWSLEAGGNITRSVNGMPDEDYLLNHMTALDSTFIAFENLHPYTLSAQDSMARMANNLRDCMLDNYYYSYPGHSGSMYLGPGARFYADKDYSKIQIGYGNHLDTISIRDDAGNTYLYGGAYDLSKTTFNGAYSRMSAGTWNRRVSWKLYAIITALKKRINFIYNDYCYTNYYQTNSQRYTSHTSSGSYNGCNFNVDNEANYNTCHFENQASLLGSIETDDQKVIFQYATDNTRAIWTKQLISMKVVSAITGDTIRRVSFGHAGDYLSSFSELDTSKATVKTYSFSYNSDSPLTPSSLSRDMYGYYNNSFNTALIADSGALLYGYSLDIANRAPYDVFAAEGTLSAVTWPTGGNTTYEYEYNTDTVNGIPVYASGLRIKYIEDHDVGGTTYNRRNFYYKGLFGGQSLIDMTGTGDGPISDGGSQSTWNPTITNVFLSDNPNLKNIHDYHYGQVITENVSPTDTTWSRDTYDIQYGIYDKITPLLVKHENFIGDTLHVLKSTTWQYHFTRVDSLRITTYVLRKPYSWVGPFYYEGNPSAFNDCGNPIYWGYDPESPLFPWIYSLVSQTDTDYSSLPGKVQAVANTYYSNPVYLKTSATTDSRGRIQSALYQYPFNFPADTTLKRMADSNWITPVIVHTDSVAGAAIFRRTNDYSFNSAGFFTVSDVHLDNLKLGGSQLFHYYSYDADGNILEQGKHGDVRKSYIYDYNKGYPVAEAVNASAADIAYTSFEADGGGNWSVGSSSRDTGAITGRQCYNLSNGNISKPALTSGNTYTISYWSKNGVKTISGGSGSSRTGRTAKGWTYYEHNLTASSTTITISGTGAIDELRLYPAGAQMTSYVYDPLIGVTAMSDTNGEAVYYEYDAFNRLKFLKDYNGNIIKSVEYNYHR